MKSTPDNELRQLAILFANRIGSPWGEGATYSHSQAEADEGDKPQENGKLYSHLDDKSFELFVNDLEQALQQLILSERIDELSSVQLEHGRYSTQTFVDGVPMTIENRIAQLKAQKETTDE